MAEIMFLILFCLLLVMAYGTFKQVQQIQAERATSGNLSRILNTIQKEYDIPEENLKKIAEQVQSHARKNREHLKRWQSQQVKTQVPSQNATNNKHPSEITKKNLSLSSTYRPRYPTYSEAIIKEQSESHKRKRTRTARTPENIHKNQADKKTSYLNRYQSAFTPSSSKKQNRYQRNIPKSPQISPPDGIQLEGFFRPARTRDTRLLPPQIFNRNTLVRPPLPQNAKLSNTSLARARPQRQYPLRESTQQAVVPFKPLRPIRTPRNLNISTPVTRPSIARDEIRPVRSSLAQNILANNVPNQIELKGQENASFTNSSNTIETPPSVQSRNTEKELLALQTQNSIESQPAFRITSQSTVPITNNIFILNNPNNKNKSDSYIERESSQYQVADIPKTAGPTNNSNESDRKDIANTSEEKSFRNNNKKTEAFLLPSSHSLTKGSEATRDNYPFNNDSIHQGAIPDQNKILSSKVPTDNVIEKNNKTAKQDSNQYKDTQVLNTLPSVISSDTNKNREKQRSKENTENFNLSKTQSPTRNAQTSQANSLPAKTTVSNIEFLNEVRTRNGPNDKNNTRKQESRPSRYPINSEIDVNPYINRLNTSNIASSTNSPGEPNSQEVFNVSEKPSKEDINHASKKILWDNSPPVENALAQNTLLSKDKTTQQVSNRAPKNLLKEEPYIFENNPNNKSDKPSFTLEKLQNPYSPNQINRSPFNSLDTRENSNLSETQRSIRNMQSSQTNSLPFTPVVNNTVSLDDIRTLKSSEDRNDTRKKDSELSNHQTNLKTDVNEPSNMSKATNSTSNPSESNRKDIFTSSKRPGQEEVEYTDKKKLWDEIPLVKSTIAQNNVNSQVQTIQKINISSPKNTFTITPLTSNKKITSSNLPHSFKTQNKQEVKKAPSFITSNNPSKKPSSKNLNTFTKNLEPLNKYPILSKQRNVLFPKQGQSYTYNNNPLTTKSSTSPPINISEKLSTDYGVPWDVTQVNRQPFFDLVKTTLEEATIRRAVNSIPLESKLTVQPSYASTSFPFVDISQNLPIQIQRLVNQGNAKVLEGEDGNRYVLLSPSTTGSGEEPWGPCMEEVTPGGETKIAYLFDIEADSEGYRIHPRYNNPGVRAQVPLSKVIYKILIDEKTMSSIGRDIHRWSINQECHMYVQLYDATKTHEKNRYKFARKKIQRYFYTFEPTSDYLSEENLSVSKIGQGAQAP
jgi:hypothetical protein